MIAERIIHYVTSAVQPTVRADGAIVVQGETVGRIRLSDIEGAIRIADIEIYPSQRNQGIGTAVIRQIQDRAAREGRAVVLSTDAMRGRQAQKDQRRLYARLGFVPNQGPDKIAVKIGARHVAEELIWRPETRR